MNAILKRLRGLGDDELLSLSEAIDVELECRLELTSGAPVSARSRANQRGQSYRRRAGSLAPPVSVVGLRKRRQNRAA